MATATAAEIYVNEVLEILDKKNTDCKVCKTCNKSFTRNGKNKHTKSNSLLLETGKISKCEI